MTLPDQRTRAIIYAREFLRKLSSAYFDDSYKKIPAPVRQEARHLLRHFPNWVDLVWPDQTLDPKAAEEYGNELAKNENKSE